MPACWEGWSEMKGPCWTPDASKEHSQSPSQEWPWTWRLDQLGMNGDCRSIRSTRSACPQHQLCLTACSLSWLNRIDIGNRKKPSNPNTGWICTFWIYLPGQQGLRKLPNTHGPENAFHKLAASQPAGGCCCHTNYFNDFIEVSFGSSKANKVSRQGSSQMIPLTHLSPKLRVTMEEFRNLSPVKTRGLVYWLLI